jgi:hypothetical protein
MDLAPLPPDFAQFYLSMDDTLTLIPMRFSFPRIGMPDMDSETSFVGVILYADGSRSNSDPVFVRLDSLRNRPVSCAAANSSRLSVIMQDNKEFLTAECESLSDSLVFVGVSSQLAEQWSVRYSSKGYRHTDSRILEKPSGRG